MVRKIAWSAMTFLALGVAAYAGAALFTTTLRPIVVENLFANMPAAISAHLLVVEWFVLARNPEPATAT